MELKTIGDLKRLIRLEGELKIGSNGITFAYPNDGGDIDISLGGKLFAWFGAPSDETMLEDAMYQVSSDFTNLQDKIDDLKGENRVLEVKFKEVENEKNSLLEVKKNNELALGKVEAYEKLLIGRDLTISK